MKTILITGASSGIGEALAFIFGAGGVRFFGGGGFGTRLEAVAEACRKLGAEVHFQSGDVRARDLMHQWIAGSDKRFKLDLVIANAGISGGTGGAVLSQSLAQSHAIFETNLTGVINTLDPVIPAMLARQGGQIAIISSLAGFAAWPGAPAYSASKAAVRYYGLALRARLAKEGVKVSVVCPGFVESRLTAQNPFPMPFLMKAPKAAALIARRLQKNPPLVVFPFATALVSRALGLLPPSLAAFLLTHAPQKNALQSEAE